LTILAGCYIIRVMNKIKTRILLLRNGTTGLNETDRHGRAMVGIRNSTSHLETAS